MRVDRKRGEWIQLLSLLVALSLMVALSGCGGSSSKTLKSISVGPGTASIGVSTTQQFTATATYSDGSTVNVTAQVAWSSASPAVATISSAGMATGVAAGSATVTAALSGVSGTATCTVTTVAPTVTAIAISPPTASVSVGGTQQFTATATYSDGSTANVTAQVAWSSATQTVATISSSGLATAVGAGSSTITASLNGVSGMAAVTVPSSAPTLKTIAVSPAAPNVSAGGTQQFTATATYSDGSTANVTTTASWASSSTSVATISSTGLATAVAAGSSTITASLNGISGTAALTVTSKIPTSISVTPGAASFAMGGTQQFTATATYSDGSTANLTSTATWSVADTSVATISSSGLASGVASGSTTVTASQNGVSGTTSIIVTIAAGTGVNIPTFHADAMRSGLNASETSLTPANVNAKTFGKLFSYLVDGYVYGEPLIMSNVTINGKVHNVLYVATEYDSVYAFDADNYGDGTPLWKVSLLKPGETPSSATDITPFLGVTSTPVIDPSTNTMYVVSAQKSSSGSTFRLNALDITTGAQKFGGPVTIQASVAGTNSQSVSGMVSLTTSCVQRAALLLADGQIYIGFGSCGSGWLLAYDARTLARTAIFNASPDLNGENKYGGAGGIWMGGGGPAADSAGNIYVTTGNGPWNVPAGNGPWDSQLSWGESVLKFNAQLQMEDYFTPDAYQFMDCQDADLASGGLMLIPGTTQAVAGGKTGTIFLVNTANLGHEQANDAGATQTLYFESDLSAPYLKSCVDSSGTNTATVTSYEIFGTAAYFNGSVYLGITPTGASVPGGVRQFTYSSGILTPGPYTSPSIQENSYGTTPFISANGANDGIMWMIDHGAPIAKSGTPTSATLRAYDATNLTDQLYNSSPNAADVPGYGIKFTSPIVANGKVYISTGHDLVTAPHPQGEIDVYGLK